MKRSNPVKNWSLCILVALSFAALGACKQADKSDTGDTPATYNAQDPNAQSQQAVEIPDERLPVETDFEKTAEQEISADNYQAELNKLEQEINKGN